MFFRVNQSALTRRQADLPPEPEDARTISLGKSGAPDDGETDAGEWLLKWMWRAILLAIAAIVAVIVFMVFDPLKLSSSPRSPTIQKVLQLLHLDDKEKTKKDK